VFMTVLPAERHSLWAACNELMHCMQSGGDPEILGGGDGGSLERSPWWRFWGLNTCTSDSQIWLQLHTLTLADAHNILRNKCWESYFSLVICYCYLQAAA